LQPPRRRVEHRRQRWRRIAGQAIARLRKNGRSIRRRHAYIHRERLLRTRISRVAAKAGAKVWAKVRAKACPAERQARVGTHGRRRTRGARSQPMQQAFHGATIER
jgi:hypothetical protein